MACRFSGSWRHLMFCDTVFGSCRCSGSVLGILSTGAVVTVAIDAANKAAHLVTVAECQSHWWDPMVIVIASPGERPDLTKCRVWSFAHFVDSIAVATVSRLVDVHWATVALSPPGYIRLECWLNAVSSRWCSWGAPLSPFVFAVGLCLRVHLKRLSSN